jgi:hypothetical protein
VAALAELLDAADDYTDHHGAGCGCHFCRDTPAGAQLYEQFFALGNLAETYLSTAEGQLSTDDTDDADEPQVVG